MAGPGDPAAASLGRGARSDALSLVAAVPGLLVGARARLGRVRLRRDPRGFALMPLSNGDGTSRSREGKFSLLMIRI